MWCCACLNATHPESFPASFAFAPPTHTHNIRALVSVRIRTAGDQKGVQKNVDEIPSGQEQGPWCQVSVLGPALLRVDMHSRVWGLAFSVQGSGFGPLCDRLTSGDVLCGR
jgi:hypothetical protein